MPELSGTSAIDPVGEDISYANLVTRLVLLEKRVKGLIVWLESQGIDIPEALEEVES